jgi:hypothetical protein
LAEHDLFGKPAATLGSSSRAGFFPIMLDAGIRTWLERQFGGGHDAGGQLRESIRAPVTAQPNHASDKRTS